MDTTRACMGVHRDFQGQGIGARLVEEGLEQCRLLGYKAVFTTGDPGYYGRFGFVPAKAKGLHTIFSSDHDMVVELEPGVLDGVDGLVQFSAPFDVFR